MRLSGSDLYARVSKATSRVQDDGGLFRRFKDKHQLDDLEFWLVTRFRYFPGSATPNDFLTFGPYTSVSRYRDALSSLVRKKLAAHAAEGRYRLAESTRKAIGDTYTEYFARVARINDLDGGQAESLFELTDRVYATAQRQGEVPVPNLSAAHSTLPDSGSIWVQLERRLAGLSLYRADAHIAAWREVGYTGPRVELSTALFGAPDGLSEGELRAAAPKLDDHDFLSALSALHSGGEATLREERYKLTQVGRAVRQAIEDATDRNYERPFAVLEDDQLDRLIELLDKLAEPK